MPHLEFGNRLLITSLPHVNFTKKTEKQPPASSPRLSIYPILLLNLKYDASLPHGLVLSSLTLT